MMEGEAILTTNLEYGRPGKRKTKDAEYLKDASTGEKKMHGRQMNLR